MNFGDLMKKQILSLVMIYLFSPTSLAQDLKPLSFLSGCWTAVNEDGDQITEDWFQRTENVLVGVSQTKNKKNEMIEHGFLDVQAESDGKVTYTPTFPGHSPTLLRLASTIAKEGSSIAVFSNPEGIVKTMTYTLKHHDELNIRYEGSGKDGQPFNFSYKFSRQNCARRF
jgi:hypothetical protein